MELGAGSSWFSIVASKIPSVKHITVIEIEEENLKYAENFFLPSLGGDKSKLTFEKGDFDYLNFDSKSMDFVLVDAALHHTNEIEKLLKNISRILNDKGFLVAIREPILPSLFLLKQFRRLTFGWRQKMNGDIENIYSKEEWEKYFSSAGFKVEFYEYFSQASFKEKIISKLHAFNGMLFNRYYIIARKIGSQELEA